MFGGSGATANAVIFSGDAIKLSGLGELPDSSGYRLSSRPLAQKPRLLQIADRAVLLAFRLSRDERTGTADRSQLLVEIDKSSHVFRTKGGLTHNLVKKRRIVA